jgi:hypothetical protein
MAVVYASPTDLRATVHKRDKEVLQAISGSAPGTDGALATLQAFVNNEAWMEGVSPRPVLLVARTAGHGIGQDPWPRVGAVSHADPTGLIHSWACTLIVARPSI